MLLLVEVSIKFLLFKGTPDRMSCASSVNISSFKKEKRKGPGFLLILALSFNVLLLADCCECMCKCTMKTKSSYHSQVLLRDVS